MNSLNHSTDSASISNQQPSDALAGLALGVLEVEAGAVSGAGALGTPPKRKSRRSWWILSPFFPGRFRNPTKITCFLVNIPSIYQCFINPQVIHQHVLQIESPNRQRSIPSSWLLSLVKIQLARSAPRNLAERKLMSCQGGLGL